MKILICLFLMIPAVSFSQSLNEEGLARITYVPGEDHYEVAMNEVDRYQVALPTSDKVSSLADEVSIFLTKPIVAPLFRFFKYYAVVKGGRFVAGKVGLSATRSVIGYVGWPTVIYVGIASAFQLVGDSFNLTGRGLGALYDYTVSRPTFHKKSQHPHSQDQAPAEIEVY